MSERLVRVVPTNGGLGSVPVTQGPALGGSDPGISSDLVAHLLGQVLGSLDGVQGLEGKHRRRHHRYRRATEASMQGRGEGSSAVVQEEQEEVGAVWGSPHRAIFIPTNCPALPYQGSGSLGKS